jgi:hypothetical protein
MSCIVVARRAVAIFVNVIVRGVVIVFVVIVGMQPHVNPAPATQASRAFWRARGGLGLICPRWPSWQMSGGSSSASIGLHSRPK